MSAWADTVTVSMGSPWDDRAWELYAPGGDIAGFGKKLKKLAKKITKPIAKAVKSVGKFVKKNWKVLALVAGAALTVYSLGTGATVLAKLKSGVGVIKTWAAGKFTAVKGWTAQRFTDAKAWFTGNPQTANTAANAAAKLASGAKFSDLPEADRRALLEAQENGVIDEDQTLTGALGGLGKVMGSALQTAGGAMLQASAPGVAASVAATKTPGDPEPTKPSTIPGWVIPAGLGALLLVML